MTSHMHTQGMLRQQTSDSSQPNRHAVDPNDMHSC